MWQGALGRLCNPSKSSHVRKVNRLLLARPLKRPEPESPGTVGTKVRSGRRGKPRPDYGLPNLTPWPLNVVNVHGSVFKAHPHARAAMCLDKSLEGEGGRVG